MLHFTPFYSTLGLGGSLGEAYQGWWNYIAQGGMTPSELSWHLGMVLLGDPTVIPAMHMFGIERPSGDNSLAGIVFNSNPCRSTLSFSYPAEHGDVDIYDTSGRIVARGSLENSECTIQINSLDSGCYITRVTADGATASASVIVLK
jgi:hypothetical protein